MSTGLTLATCLAVIVAAVVAAVWLRREGDRRWAAEVRRRRFREQMRFLGQAMGGPVYGVQHAREFGGASSGRHGALDGTVCASNLQQGRRTEHGAPDAANCRPKRRPARERPRGPRDGCEAGR